MSLPHFPEYWPGPIQIHETLKTNFNNGAGKLANVAYRKTQLLQLGYAFQDNFKLWEEALAKDMGRPRIDSYMCDVLPFFSFLGGIDQWL